MRKISPYDEILKNYEAYYDEKPAAGIRLILEEIQEMLNLAFQDGYEACRRDSEVNNPAPGT